MACCAVAAYIVFRFLGMHERLVCALQIPKSKTIVSETNQQNNQKNENLSFHQLPEKSQQRRCGDTCTLSLSGLTCISCAGDIRKIINAMPGIVDVSVSSALFRAHVIYDKDAISPEAIAAAVRDAGYGAQPVASRTESSTDRKWSGVFPGICQSTAAYESEALRWQRAFRMAVESSVIVAGLQGARNWLPSRILPLLILTLLDFAMCAAVAASIMATSCLHLEAVRRMWQGRSPNMATLASLGIAAALAQALLGWMGDASDSRYGYYHPALDNVPLLGASVLGGRLLKALLAKHNLDFGAPLLRLLPSEVEVLQGLITKTEIVPLDMLAPSDRIVVRYGERIPCDGIVEGTTAAEIDESWMTGSKILRIAKPGETVFAGSSVCSPRDIGSLQHHIIIEARVCGSSTRLGQTLMSMLNADQGNHGDADTMTDPYLNIVSHFAVGVLICTAAACAIHEWLSPVTNWESILGRAAAMLLAACPCALGLSVPVAQLLVTYQAARAGIQITSGTSFSRMKRTALAGVVLFDKTGTLTTGVLKVVQAIPDNGCWDKWLWQALAQLEEGIDHPVARAIVLEAQQHSGLQDIDEMFGTLETNDVHQEPGCGIRATVTGPEIKSTSPFSGPVTLSVGSQKYMASFGINTSLASVPVEFRSAIATIVIVAIDGVQAGVLVLADSIRPDAAETVKQLRRHYSVQVGMVTGDSAASAAAVAREVGIDRSMVFAECMPTEKSSIVREFEKKQAVIFVGDHLNDIPSFASASFGVYVGDGNSLTADSVAHATLAACIGGSETGTISRVVVLLRLLRRAQNVDSQNLVWAFTYNTAALLYTSGVFGSTLLSP